MAVLDQAGYRTKEALSIYYRPKFAGLEEMYTLILVVERELNQLEETLELSNKLMIGLAKNGLGLCIPMRRLEHDELEKSLRMYYSLVQMAGMQRTNAVVG